ncbi:unnamed protein product [Hymenolepis diminuta]|uniref:Uncharacterized protein n=1 Tax=Hymenolepis diminuta TaxID=6216 RepID=A0A564XUG4_HYMDI|nr:unnamed protein product [Hymenolepis diminuta]
MMDSYSEWLKVIPPESATVGTIINSLHQTFSTQSLPKIIASWNITQFSSTRFEDLLSWSKYFFYALRLTSTALMSFLSTP